MSSPVVDTKSKLVEPTAQKNATPKMQGVDFRALFADQQFKEVLAGYQQKKAELSA